MKPWFNYQLVHWFSWTKPVEVGDLDVVTEASSCCECLVSAFSSCWQALLLLPLLLLPFLFDTGLEYGLIQLGLLCIWLQAWLTNQILASLMWALSILSGVSLGEVPRATGLGRVGRRGDGTVARTMQGLQGWEREEREECLLSHCVSCISEPLLLTRSCLLSPQHLGIVCIY